MTFGLWESYGRVKQCISKCKKNKKKLNVKRDESLNWTFILSSVNVGEKEAEEGEKDSL